MTTGARATGAESRRLEAIVLAAGAGRRFGGGKLTAPWGEGVLLDGALAAAFAAPVRTVTVVTGADPKVADAARAFAERAGEAARLRLVHAADHEEGMGASLRAGVAALPSDAEGVFVFLGDMPRVRAEMAAALVAALGDRQAAVSVHAGRRGHPALFTAALFPKLRSLAGDAGARTILEELGESLATVVTPDAGVLFDVDTRDQLG
jgi:molybdenum cofactor cytidylyltransferase